jgi:hypothetical protein
MKGAFLVMAEFGFALFEPCGTYLFSGAGNQGFAVFVEPVSCRFGQGDSVFAEQGAGGEFVFAVGNGVGIKLSVDALNGGLLGRRLGAPLAFAA